MALDKPLEDVTIDDLNELIANKVAERKVIDYKAELKIGSDAERKEFLADISSFANAAGGVLLFGVTEDDGYPTDVPGIEIESEDQLLLKLEGMVRSGIAPRPSVESHIVNTEECRGVLILRTPVSWSRPHMVTFKGHDKFYGRDSRGKFPMDVQQIRASFLLSDQSAERIRNFRVERVGQIVASQTSPILAVGARVILHIVPLNAFAPGAPMLDLLGKINAGDLRPIYSSGWSHRPNFEGVVSWGGDDGPTTRSYLQLFRNGTLEAAISWPGRKVDDGRILIPSITYEQEVHRSLPGFLALEQKIGAEPPFFVMMSIVGIGGFSLGVDMREDLWGSGRVIERNELLLPEAIVDSYEAEPGPILKPMFDMVWNAAGHPRSLNYNDDGSWRARG